VIRFIVGIVAGAAALFVGAWVWIVRHARRQTTPVNNPEEETKTYDHP